MCRKTSPAAKTLKTGEPVQVSDPFREATKAVAKALNIPVSTVEPFVRSRGRILAKLRTGEAAMIKQAATGHEVLAPYFQ